MASVKFIEKLLDQLRKSRLFFILPIFSGLLLGAGFIFPSLRILVWIALLPLFFSLDLKEISFKKAFWSGYLAGFIFFGQVLLWGFEISPSNFTDIKNEVLNFSLVFLTWLVSAGFLALFVGLFSLSYRFLRKNFWDILLISSLWVILEYLRVWAFGIFMAGSESLSGPHWTLGNLAYSLAQNQSFLFLASIGGIYLISFLIVLVNAILFYTSRCLISKKEKVKIWHAAAFLIILSLVVVSYFLVLPAEKTGEGEVLRVAIVQTKIPSSFSLRELADTKNQTQRQLLENIAQSFAEVDVIVLPEGSNFLEQEGSKEYLANLFVERNVWIIDSGKNEERKFVGFLYNIKEETSARYEKRLLIPYGDYLPYTFEFISRAVSKKWLEGIKKLKWTKKGDNLPILTVSKENKIGFLFCSESVSPYLHRKLAEKGSQLFFNAGSLAFSQGSKILDSQTLAMLQFRAAENRKYLVRSTNFGRSYIINNRGDVVKITSDLENQIIFGEVRLLSQKTIYTKHGDWILIAAGLLVLTFFLTRGILKQREKVET